MRGGGASVLVSGALRIRRGLLPVLLLLESPLDPLQFVDQGGTLRAERLGVMDLLAARFHVAHAIRLPALLTLLMPHVVLPAH